MIQSPIFSPGKLLLTSEYFVLDGALALAVPTKAGQEMVVRVMEDQASFIFWEAHHQNRPWLKAVIDFTTWEIIETNDVVSAEFVKKTLQNVEFLRGGIFEKGNSYHIKTNLQFPSNYGLGSSSTLMTNLASWAGVCPFKLNEISLGGSGYDIAVAERKTAILYSCTPKREIKSMVYKPDFYSELIFIHLNQKKDSREGIRLYRSKEKSTSMIDEMSSLTNEILNAKNMSAFSNLMDIHEGKVSEFLGLETVKSSRFSDCPVFVKSLGAWGGDFVLTQKFEGYRAYFSDKGFADIWDWEQLIL